MSVDNTPREDVVDWLRAVWPGLLVGAAVVLGVGVTAPWIATAAVAASQVTWLLRATGLWLQVQLEEIKRELASRQT